MKKIGEYQSGQWGHVTVNQSTYPGTSGKGGEDLGDGPTAVSMLCNTDGYDEPLATLSVNLYKPDCSHDSRDLPAGCFYVKCWAENESIAIEVFQATGLFIERPDLGTASSGFIRGIPVWQVKP